MKEIFKIYPLSAEESIRIQQSVNEPHQHDFEELLIGKEGRLEHFIDFASQSIPAPFVSFVTRGKLHQAKPFPDENGNCKIWVIRFKSEFIPETTFQLYASFHNKANFSMTLDSCFGRLDILSRMMYEEYQLESPDYGVLRQLLSTVFTMIESERRKQHPDEDASGTRRSMVFKDFLQLLENNYKQSLGVEFYASKLFMSVRNLNLICQQILQQSISEIIETRKLTEAKNLLITTELSIAEIGFELGFKEKTNFSHTFKKKSGQTPSEFRTEMTKLIS